MNPSLRKGFEGESIKGLCHANISTKETPALAIVINIPFSSLCIITPYVETYVYYIDRSSMFTFLSL